MIYILRLLASMIVLSALARAQVCVPAATLRPVDSITGSLGDADCTLSGGSTYAVYFLTLPTFGQLQLNASGADFPVSLMLRDTAGRMVAGGPGVSSIQQTIERGEYTLLVDAQAPGQLGAFNLTSAFTPEPATLCRGITRIGPTQTISGHLLDASCLQFNNAPYDSYLVSILGSGTLNVTLTSPNFSGMVTVQEGGGALASDPMSVSVPVDGATDYTIIVAGADSSSRGDYQMSVSFTPADGETCRSQGSLAASQSVHGTISDDSCSSPSGLMFQYYDLPIAAPGLADLRVQPSGDIATLVSIFDRNGRLVSQDLESGGYEQPILRQQLPAGQYTVQVGSQSTGAYTLQYRFFPGPPETCPALTLAPGTQTGSLAGASSCRSVDSMQDTYRIATTAPGTLSVTLSSGDFDGSLLIEDSKGNNLAQSDGADAQAPQILADLPAGTYSLAAFSIDPGNYALTYQFTAHDLAPCPPPQPLDVNTGYNNVLGLGVCHGPDGQLADWYQFSTPSPGMVGLFMTSGDLDAYLTLTDSQGSVLRRDDNSFGGTDSMILQWTTGQTFNFSATASLGSQMGRYQVDVLYLPGGRPPGCLPMGDLTPGARQGTLAIASCQYLDDTFADVYRLQVATPGNLNIEMDSDTLDAYLILLDPMGNVVDQDDDSAGGTNALLTTLVDPGIYYVVAKSYSASGYIMGDYVLSMQ